MSLQRFRRLAPRNPISLMYRYYRYILPEVRSELDKWRRKAGAIPDPELSKQALASIGSKQFHCEGGAVYVTADLPTRKALIPLIVAFQTISDYLDNLCDRSTSLDGADFRLLHQSMLDAINPATEPANYYELHPEKDDGGYLTGLVIECQTQIRNLPGYSTVSDDIRMLVSLYCDLQVHKHIDKQLREQALLTWWEEHSSRYPSIEWNEFAAATGSTLGVFMLFVAAVDPGVTREDSAAIVSCYFPYICGLHILLDYLIDQEEDRIGGDLNFCFYYDDPKHAAKRIGWIADQARSMSRQLSAPRFHKMVAEGLMALYLSDPKTSSQSDVMLTRKRLMKGSPLVRLFFWINSMWVRRSH